ncbi:MAG: hypothetical protein A2087_13795 [Spirochaetes bacterium GWD1_61_31]|nr:MAG: hypothetical protein A2Y37_10320 [Spirochaetes bacterium GWB1_60_80]OHD33753.1 MAG: hypothetical protein A2004_09590 [Spirochaetes bacterium GWC1_61_12]OHD38976.1 MAG: hypothetical protein A2087_13795 [Spirochaetes bacterium GWD1_61_31]OHD43426.1 MAG: hypothetical protein A2Y35_11690 [Spirochaetes bacterium GWE1_60_18]OHD58957.1 MAG: hypothetical protein A2Y32_10480 [Spirochaetes bacterium GWF1_60_12]
MIPGNPVYLRAESAAEAVQAWLGYPEARYLAGGTEIHTLARRSAAYRVGALIDIKGIAALRSVEASDGWLRLGAAVSLNELADAGSWPFLSAVARAVADRTVRNRLSLGGNIIGQLPYREAALPLLVAGAEVLSVLPGPGGIGIIERRRALRDCFDKRLALEPAELVTGFAVPLAATRPDAGRFYAGRRTRTGSVDYPLITLCAQLHTDVAGLAARGLAVGGLYSYPWRSDATDAVFGQAVAKLRQDGAQPAAGAEMAGRRHDQALLRSLSQAIAETLPPPRTDSRASGEYRLHLLQQLLAEALEELT